MCVYESYSAAQQSAHDSEVLCFYPSGFQALVALIHHSAKKLGTSLSCPEPKAASKKRPLDTMVEDKDRIAHSSCILVKFKLRMAQIHPVRALLVINHESASPLVHLILHLCVCMRVCV